MRSLPDSDVHLSVSVNINLNVNVMNSISNTTNGQPQSLDQPTAEGKPLPFSQSADMVTTAKKSGFDADGANEQSSETNEGKPGQIQNLVQERLKAWSEHYFAHVKPWEAEEELRKKAAARAKRLAARKAAQQAEQQQQFAQQQQQQLAQHQQIRMAQHQTNTMTTLTTSATTSAPIRLSGPVVVSNNYVLSTTTTNSGSHVAAPSTTPPLYSLADPVTPPSPYQPYSPYSPSGPQVTVTTASRANPVYSQLASSGLLVPPEAPLDGSLTLQPVAYAQPAEVDPYNQQQLTQSMDGSELMMSNGMGIMSESVDLSGLYPTATTTPAPTMASGVSSRMSGNEWATASGELQLMSSPISKGGAYQYLSSPDYAEGNTTEWMANSFTSQYSAAAESEDSGLYYAAVQPVGYPVEQVSGGALRVVTTSASPLATPTMPQTPQSGQLQYTQRPYPLQRLETAETSANAPPRVRVVIRDGADSNIAGMKVPLTPSSAPTMSSSAASAARLSALAKPFVPRAMGGKTASCEMDMEVGSTGSASDGSVGSGSQPVHPLPVDPNRATQIASQTIAGPSSMAGSSLAGPSSRATPAVVLQQQQPQTTPHLRPAANACSAASGLYQGTYTNPELGISFTFPVMRNGTNGGSLTPPLQPVGMGGPQNQIWRMAEHIAQPTHAMRFVPCDRSLRKTMQVVLAEEAVSFNCSMKAFCAQMQAHVVQSLAPGTTITFGTTRPAWDRYGHYAMEFDFTQVSHRDATTTPNNSTPPLSASYPPSALGNANVTRAVYGRTWFTRAYHGDRMLVLQQVMCFDHEMINPPLRPMTSWDIGVTRPTPLFTSRSISDRAGLAARCIQRAWRRVILIRQNEHQGTSAGNSYRRFSKFRGMNSSGSQSKLEVPKPAVFVHSPYSMM